MTWRTVILHSASLTISTAAYAQIPVVYSGKWLITEVADEPLKTRDLSTVTGPRPHIILDQVGEEPIDVLGLSGCNGFNRTIAHPQDAIDQGVTATMMHCGEDLEIQEFNMFNILMGSPRFSFNSVENEMRITGENGRMIVAVSDDSSSSRFDGTWQVTGISTVDLSTELVTFKIDNGVMVARSQCVWFRWEFDVTGTTIMVERAMRAEGDARPIVMCARALTRLEVAYSEMMDSAVSYSFEADGQLTFTAPEGSFTLRKL